MACRAMKLTQEQQGLRLKECIHSLTKMKCILKTPMEVKSLLEVGLKSDQRLGAILSDLLLQTTSKG
jgi:hypothetical protein